MNINLTHILLAIIELIAVLITYRLIPWIKAKTTNEQQAYIRALVKAGVFAAEQIYNTDGMGKQKMEYVKEFLYQHGFDINVTEIEAAVKEYINPPVLPTLPVAAIPIDELINPGEPVDTPEE